MTDILIDARRGAGSSLEILYGTVTWKPTLTHSRGTSVVLPAPTTYDLVDGQVVATNVQPTPAPVGGQIEWAYEVTFKDRHGKTFSFLVGVPDSTSQVNFISLPRYFETKPPLFGQGPQGDPGESATVAVGTVTGGTTAQVNNSGTNTDAVLDFVLPQGPQGPKGDGTFDEYRSANGQAPYRQASDGPNTYPKGFITGLYASAEGWPHSTFSSVTTFSGAYGASKVQIATPYNGATGEPMIRYGLTSTTWTPFKPLRGDLATATANGLMSSADKGKLNGILAGSSTATPDTTVNRDSAGGTALNSLTLSTVPDDPASATNKAYVDGRVLNTPYLYGAVGDGLTSDTQAITDWLNSPNPVKHLDRGTFLTSAQTLSTSNVTISGMGGTLQATGTSNSIVLTLTGDNVTVQNVEVNGNNIARGGIYFTGQNPKLLGSHLHRFRTANSLAYGVMLENQVQGYLVRDNTFENIHSVGNATLGDSNGPSRAVYVSTSNSTLTGETVGRGIIKGNTMRNITGEEGDSIQVIVMPDYGSAKVDIVDNNIVGFSRRGIKLQAGDCVVKNNALYTNAIANSYANPSTGIDSQYAANNVIADNEIELIGFTGGITCVGGESSSNRKSTVVIKGNTLRGGTITCRYIDQGVIQDNVVFFVGTYGLYATASPAVAVKGNTLHAVGSMADRSAIFINQGCERAAVVSNLLMSGEVAYIVNMNSINGIVKHNDSLSLNSAEFNANGSASVGTLYSDNSSQSSAQSLVGYNFQQKHRGFDNTRAGSYIPNVYHSTTDPTLNGRIHTKGDIYYDFSAQAVTGGYVGWICTAAGQPGTFKRFGLIA